ncbi:hypothetical protein LEN26_006230 [Aphanomyces euteiches]|nr:hypothetical protein LEN26_006230 [Aphanomyces euteiches]
MKLNPKTLVSKSEVKRLRKQRQFRAKKQAKLLKQFRRVEEDTKADKIHQDLVNTLHHVQRINKKFEDIILTDFSEQDKKFKNIIQSLLHQVNTLTESSLQILDHTVPLEISKHIATDLSFIRFLLPLKASMVSLLGAQFRIVCRGMFISCATA